MKILVTGACGTIGLAVTEKLANSGHEVIGYDRVGSDLPYGATLIEGDVRDFARVTWAARGWEAGIHLAAVADGATVSDILSINALGAYGFLAAAKRPALVIATTAFHRLVSISTSAGDCDRGRTYAAGGRKGGRRSLVHSENTTATCVRQTRRAGTTGTGTKPAAATAEITE